MKQTRRTGAWELTRGWGWGFGQRIQPRETLAGDTWGLMRQRACLGCRGKAPPVLAPQSDTEGIGGGNKGRRWVYTADLREVRVATDLRLENGTDAQGRRNEQVARSEAQCEESSNAKDEWNEGYVMETAVNLSMESCDTATISSPTPEAASDQTLLYLGKPYLEYIDNLSKLDAAKREASKIRCPGWFLIGGCEDEHKFGAKIYCHKEWCSVCGERNSPAHLRRFSRWLPKAQQLEVMGYWVFTITESRRRMYKTKKSLDTLMKKLVCGDSVRNYTGILKDAGFARGLYRWHFYSEKQPGKYNPHLNVLVEAAKLEPAMIAKIKRAWAKLLHVPMAVVNYRFTRLPKGMVHNLKYVTRATFLDEAWDPELASELWNFRNMRSWGKWNGEEKWTMSKNVRVTEVQEPSAIEAVVKLSNNICPDCGKPITWRKPYEMRWFDVWKMTDSLEPIGAGFYRVNRKEAKGDVEGL